MDLATLPPLLDAIRKARGSLLRGRLDDDPAEGVVDRGVLADDPDGRKRGRLRGAPW